MSLETFINFLLSSYAPLALPIAVGASIAVLLLPVFYILARGQAIRRSATGRGRSFWATLWSGLLFFAIPIAIISWISIGGRQLVLNRGGILDEKLAQRLAVLIGIAVFGVWLGIFFLCRPSSPLSETINLLTGGVRRRKDELGSAHFADKLEYKRFATKHPNGVTFLGEFRGEEFKPNQYRILGNLFSLSGEDAARGIITIGNPGSGKSQSIILPTIADSMKDGESLIVTDPQGELKPQILDFARVTGHIVIIHDPTDDACARFNLVEGIETVSNARSIAEVLLPSSQGNDFWQGSARALLAACMIRFGTIGQIVEKLGKLEELIADLERENDDARFLVSDFIDAAKNAPKQASGVTATIMRALDAWADSTVRGSTQANDFRAANIVKSKQPIVVLLSCPGRDRRALAPYLGAVLTKLLLDLDSIGERIAGGALPRPIKFILEEFPAMGNLSIVVEQANLVRKRRISFLLACQTIGQLQNIYGKDGAATLLAGMATQIIFGGADKETASYFSSLAGNQTKTIETEAYRPGQPAQKRSVERPLLTHDQIISPPHAPQGNVIIFTRYVTESYAVNAVILARLTRMYERQDWKSQIAQAKQRKPRFYTRGNSEKRKRQSLEKPLAAESVSAQTSQMLYELPKPEQASKPTYQKAYLRVIDDSTPPDEQNVVIPYPVKDLS
jgi:type IV secretory pathway TraG/TraD family ATPase VirD4